MPRDVTAELQSKLNTWYRKTRPGADKGLVEYCAEAGWHGTLAIPYLLSLVQAPDQLTPYFMVPKNTIFGSSVLEKDSYSLVSCVVAPGFDFRDFELFDSVELVKQYPREYEIISKLTS